MIITLLQRQLYYKTSNKVEVARPELFLCKTFFFENLSMYYPDAVIKEKLQKSEFIDSTVIISP